MTFKTDVSVSGPGFFAHIQQEECDPRSLQSPDECSQDIRYCSHAYIFNAVLEKKLPKYL